MSQNQLVAATLLHCGFQGILLALLPGVLSKERGENRLFKAHIIAVNVVALGQTIISGFVPFNGQDHGGGRRAPPFLPPLCNAFLSISVQGFYILRCWRVVGRRWAGIFPYLFLWLVAAGSSLAISVLNSSVARSNDLLDKQKAAMAVWVFSSFIMDLLMTLTTGFYLYKTHTGTSRRHNGVFMTAWNIIWAAAIPPMGVMIGMIIDGYLIPGSDHSIATFFAEISGKIYALSLMITLAGRGYVRQKLSEVNIGRMSSGGAGPSRSAQIDPITTRARSARYQHDRAMSGGVVAVQLDDFTSRTNPVVAGEAVGDHNDSDGEAAPSQYSKTDDAKFRI